DYVAAWMTGSVCTTVEGLSEGIFWDFAENRPSARLLDAFGFDASLLPEVKPTFGLQGVLSREAARELGLQEGTPVTYRAGDQPNNALSLGVLNPGQIASTAGTSGVVYGVIGQVAHDPLSRVNPFAHVNHSAAGPRLGVLLCINGTGILNAWMRRNVAPEGSSYIEMNELAASAPVGSDGISILPFGNGTERMLENRDRGCSIHGVDFNRHGKAQLLRAAQEGIVFAFCYGIEIMQQMGLKVDRIHAGQANMFLSPVFRQTLAGTSGATIELYDTDGSAGAARGAGIGAGIYRTADEAFSTLERVAVEEPASGAAYRAAYERWKSYLKS
ncbi:MAG: carbohydrate kinase, partial [Bacteroidales bacterium]|nr:carbohydrate kinase [Bacteroidales bacterium]